MDTNPYEAGRNDMREQLVAFIYEHYQYNKTFFGREAHSSLELKRLILDIRENQAHEQDKLIDTEIAAE